MLASPSTHHIVIPPGIPFPPTPYPEPLQPRGSTLPFLLASDILNKTSCYFQPWNSLGSSLSRFSLSVCPLSSSPSLLFSHPQKWPDSIWNLPDATGYTHSHIYKKFFSTTKKRIFVLFSNVWEFLKCKKWYFPLMKEETVLKVVNIFKAINNRSTNTRLFPAWEWTKSSLNNLHIFKLNTVPFPMLISHSDIFYCTLFGNVTKTHKGKSSVCFYCFINPMILSLKIVQIFLNLNITWNHLDKQSCEKYRLETAFISPHIKHSLLLP